MFRHFLSFKYDSLKCDPRSTEELQPGQKSKVSVTLVDDAGNEKLVSVEDDWLTENSLDVGSEWPLGV